MKQFIKSAIKWAVSLHDVRESEYKAVERFIGEINSETKILDIGCGTGTFLLRFPNNSIGIDINPENVTYAVSKGLNASVGSALKIPFKDNSFDVVHCSHVMQIFNNSDAQTFVKEASRVCKPGGLLVVSTLNWFPNFWQHPENARPYPPDVWSVYSSVQQGSTSPMWEKMPILLQESIYFRRTALLCPKSYQFKRLNYLFRSVISIQLRLGITAFWKFDAYTIKLRVVKLT